jgi:hypothetical protein
VDKLIVLPELLEPAGARLPFVALAPGARLSMGTSRGEVHEVFLLDAEDGVHARLDQQGKRRLGTKAPVGDQDITGAQRRLEPDHCGESMRVQGGRQAL